MDININSVGILCMIFMLFIILYKIFDNDPPPPAPSPAPSPDNSHETACLTGRPICNNKSMLNEVNNKLYCFADNFHKMNLEYHNGDINCSCS